MNYLVWCNDLISNFENQGLVNMSNFDLLTLLWNYKIQNAQVCNKEDEVVNELLERKMRNSLWGGWGELLIVINSLYNKEERKYKLVVKKVKRSLNYPINIGDFHTYDFVNGYVGNLHSLLVTQNVSVSDMRRITVNLIFPLYHLMINRVSMYDWGFAHGLCGVLYVLKEYYEVSKSNIVKQTIDLIEKYIYSICDHSFRRLILCDTKGLDKSVLKKNINFSWCYGNLMLGSLIDSKCLNHLLTNCTEIIKKEFTIWSKDRKTITCHGLMGPLLFFKFRFLNNNYVDLIENIGLEKIKYFFEQFPKQNIVSDNNLNPYSEFDGTTSTIMFLCSLSKKKQNVIREYAKLFGLGN